MIGEEAKSDNIPVHRFVFSCRGADWTVSRGRKPCFAVDDLAVKSLFFTAAISMSNMRRDLTHTSFKIVGMKISFAFRQHAENFGFPSQGKNCLAHYDNHS
jgi:hypothetical protein